MSGTPEWVQDAVFYQIFPDRFANGDPANDPFNVKPWDALPTIKGFHGGDLQGVIQNLDYLVDLGINAIYFNPIFQAASTHRYDTYDYLKIDPKLGTMKDFSAMVEALHARGIRIVIDGVFNHCGRGFFAFNDIMENGTDSPYINWFHVKQVPLDAYSEGEAEHYLGWWGYKSLPKFNTDEPDVREYLLRVARFWIDAGADGWRLDVPNEIDDDAFWADFRHVVKTANPEAYIVGEIWDGNPRWVGESHFDGLMNYPVRDAVFDVLSGENNAKEFAGRVEKLLTMYPDEYVRSMLVLLGSHDTRRILRKFEGDKAKVKLAYLFPFAYPGAPCVYYGDEIGLDGGKDPDCRRTFPWNREAWDDDLRSWIKQLIQMRHDVPALRRGEMKQVFVSKSCYSFTRTYQGETVLVAFNFSGKQHLIEFDAHLVSDAPLLGLKDILTGEQISVIGGNVQLGLPALGGMVLKPI
ncbi:MAG: glycoside hydrolase family 13 protein [Anaerolineae bacterium]|nr:glycoside hydrolase family 13 protein [Anaerolineae bacterium]